MAQRTRPSTVKLLAAGGLVLACAAMLLALAAMVATAGSDMRRAQERWAARPFDQYRLRVTIREGATLCRMHVRVRGEEVIEVLGVAGDDIACLDSLQTVTDLFAYVEAYESPGCLPNGCACDGRIGMEAVYHPEWGYPTQVAIDVQQEGRALRPAFWLHWLRGGLCTQNRYLATELTARLIIEE